MLNPNLLSEDALTVLRLFAHTDRREEGCGIPLAAIIERRETSHRDLEVGLADLKILGLLRCNGDEAVVTPEGAAFFDRYFMRCHR